MRTDSRMASITLSWLNVRLNDGDMIATIVIMILFKDRRAAS
jgi:hypothetical protein